MERYVVCEEEVEGEGRRVAVYITTHIHPRD